MGKILSSYIGALKKHNWFKLVHLCLFVQIAIGILFVRPDLSKSVEEPHIIHHVAGITIPLGGFNPVTVGVTWLIMIALVSFALLVRKNLNIKPSKLQIVAEKIVGGFTMLCRDALGEMGVKFVPLIGTIFLLIWFSNLVGVFPLPYLEEPTANVNYTLGIGIVSFIINHLVAIKVRGLGSWAKGYCFSMPLFIGLPLLILIGGHFVVAKFTEKSMFIPLIIAALVVGQLIRMSLPKLRFYIPNPLDVIGEAGKVVSHSMRLFGNIFGGLIIMIVISKLTRYIMFPTLLSGFFGIFVGTVQAFVFAMLALIYTAVLVAEDE